MTADERYQEYLAFMRTSAYYDRYTRNSDIENTPEANWFGDLFAISDFAGWLKMTIVEGKPLPAHFAAILLERGLATQAEAQVLLSGDRAAVERVGRAIVERNGQELA